MASARFTNHWDANKELANFMAIKFLVGHSTRIFYETLRVLLSTKSLLKLSDFEYATVSYEFLNSSMSILIYVHYLCSREHFKTTFFKACPISGHYPSTFRVI